MKKVLTALLVTLMLMSLLASCASPSGSDSPSDTPESAPVSPDDVGDTAPTVGDHETFKIAVLEIGMNDESVIRSNYFQNYIGPRYNCEFMFSEACGTTEAAMTFIENAALAGCVGVINYFAIDTEQLVQLCQEKGMFYVDNANRNAKTEPVYTGGYDNFGGGFAANQQNTGKLFYNYLSENLDADGDHGFLVCTSAAYLGGEQQYEISSNLLTAIQDVYGLTFETSIHDLVLSASPIEAVNDLGVAVYVYPGTAAMDGWLQGLSAALQTGRYDYCLYSMQGYVDTAVTVSEVESSFNKDITVISFGSFGDNLTNAFSTQDQFGNPTLNMSTVKFTSLVSAMGFVQMYNGLTGQQDVLRDANGEMTALTFNMQAVTSPEQLSQMSSWDTTDRWVGDYGLIDSCLGVLNPGLTAAQIQANFDAVTSESIAARLG